MLNSTVKMSLTHRKMRDLEPHLNTYQNNWIEDKKITVKECEACLQVYLCISRDKSKHQYTCFHILSSIVKCNPHMEREQFFGPIIFLYELLMDESNKFAVHNMIACKNKAQAKTRSKIIS
jgi:hypothetical protein